MNENAKISIIIPVYNVEDYLPQCIDSILIQSYKNIERTQDRITGFIAEHSKISQKRLEELMLDPTQLVKDVGTMLEGEDAVREGLIDEVGGISQAMQKLREMIDERRGN